jgi:hypothetical protein
MAVITKTGIMMAMGTIALGALVEIIIANQFINNRIMIETAIAVI